MSDNNLYFLGYQDDTIQPFDSTYYYIFNWNGQNFSPKETHLYTHGTGHQWGEYSIWHTRDKVYSSGYGVYILSDNQWTKALESTWALVSIRGSSVNNIFAVGIANNVFHYNGYDWARLYPIDGQSFSWGGVYATGDEVFIAGGDGLHSIIVHGR